MTIKLIQGPRNEEKIAAIKEAKRTCTPEEWEEFVLNCAEDEEWLDALYYASDCGACGLEEQELYFHDLLLRDEQNYFAARLGGIEF